MVVVVARNSYHDSCVVRNVFGRSSGDRCTVRSHPVEGNLPRGMLPGSLAGDRYRNETELRRVHQAIPRNRSINILTVNHPVHFFLGYSFFIYLTIFYSFNTDEQSEEMEA